MLLRLYMYFVLVFLQQFKRSDSENLSHLLFFAPEPRCAKRASPEELLRSGGSLGVKKSAR